MQEAIFWKGPQWALYVLYSCEKLLISWKFLTNNAPLELFEALSLLQYMQVTEAPEPHW